MRREVIVCNVCREPGNGLRHYVVESLGRRATLDLCVIHAEGLERLLTRSGAATQAVPRSRTRTTTGYAKYVASIEEVEAARRT